MEDHIDNLNFEDDSDIKNLIGSECILFSDKIQKIHKGIFKQNQQRNFLITDQAIYNLKEKQLKRRIDIKNLKGLTISKLSDQFIIQGNQDEYDYLYESNSRFKIVSILQNTFENLTGKTLLFCIKNEKDLDKYVVGDKERAKNPKAFKIETKELMSIKEFIDSNGNLNINTHPNSLKLETEFQKSSQFYKDNVSFNDFNIICLIGRGNTSNVYYAQYNGEDVALKVFDKVQIYQNKLIDKILLEKNILCSFETEDFLCHMKFFFMTDAKICFVLPFYNNGDLYSLLEKKGNFDESTTAFFGVQVAKMLSFLHGRNIVYRDLKPENLMINEKGYLTLIDFGSCKIIEEKTELQSSFIGSIDYLSPEIINGEGHSFMSDWWSFGILLYELLFGIPPFHGGDTERILDLITASNVTYPTKKPIAAATKELINKLLKKNPRERIGQNEYSQIIALQFFKSVDANSISSQKASPPVTVDSSDYNENFDGLYTNYGAEDFNQSFDSSELGQIQNYFDDFKE